MSIKLRACLETDIPSITAIYAHAVTHGTASFELVPPDQAEMSRRRAALIDGGFPYLVAERDDAVVGYAYAGPYRPRPAYRSTVEDSIYVAPEAQGVRDRQPAAGAAHRGSRSAGFPSDGGGDRGRGIARLHRASPKPRVRPRRNPAGDRLQAWSLVVDRADAAGSRTGNCRSADARVGGLRRVMADCPLQDLVRFPSGSCRQRQSIPCCRRNRPPDSAADALFVAPWPWNRGTQNERIVGAEGSDRRSSYVKSCSPHFRWRQSVRRSQPHPPGTASCHLMR